MKNDVGCPAPRFQALLHGLEMLRKSWEATAGPSPAMLPSWMLGFEAMPSAIVVARFLQFLFF